MYTLFRGLWRCLVSEANIAVVGYDIFMTEKLWTCFSMMYFCPIGWNLTLASFLVEWILKLTSVHQLQICLYLRDFYLPASFLMKKWLKVKKNSHFYHGAFCQVKWRSTQAEVDYAWLESPLDITVLLDIY